MDLNEILSKLTGEQKKEVADLAIKQTLGMVFIPSQGKQLQAYLSKADILLFGGNPGGGKTALGCGWALNESERALLLRKNFSDLEAIIHTLTNITGSFNGLVKGNRPEYRKPEGGIVHMEGLGDNIDGKQGNPHDFIYFDEAAQFPEYMVRMAIGWLRTSKDNGMRCRVIMGSNPPLNSTGDWLITFFAPWLDDRHPNPAKEGELRWFRAGDDGKDIECNEGEYSMIAGKRAYAMSRTYISSTFDDNPYYDAEDYARKLALLPIEHREKLLSGNFMLARDDDPLQCIPTQWVREAMARWTPQPLGGIPMCAIGVDVAQGGKDSTVLAIRYDGWYAPLIKEKGVNTPTGAEVAGIIFKHRLDGAVVVVDNGGGYGGDTIRCLRNGGIDAVAYKGSDGSTARTKDRTLKFNRKRAEIYWRLREALDPSQEHGSPIMLPPDNELLSDLTSVWRVPEFSTGGIELERKTDMAKRLGRSPDKGDAVAMAWSEGNKAITHATLWRAAGETGRRGVPLQTNYKTGYENRKRR